MKFGDLSAVVLDLNRRLHDNWTILVQIGQDVVDVVPEVLDLFVL